MNENVRLTDGTSVSLQEYVERIFDEREKTLERTAQSLEHRLETLNELRSDVLKDRELFVTKVLYNEMHQALLERVTRVEKMQSRLVGVGIALVAGSGLVGAFLSHLLKP